MDDDLMLQDIRVATHLYLYPYMLEHYNLDLYKTLEDIPMPFVRYPNQSPFLLVREVQLAELLIRLPLYNYQDSLGP